MALFELRAAHVHYDGVTVLRDVSLSVRRGERVALVGRSGAGKSTLLNLLYTQQPELCALVPQRLALVHNLSVFHNVYIGRLDRNPGWYNLANLVWPLGREIRLVRPVLERLGLEDKLFAPVGELSGGQQQRTAVGRALYREGRVLIGDEPVSAVDEYQAQVMLTAIGERYDTVLLAMHDTQLALAHTDRVIGIKDGRLIMDESARGLRPADLEFLYAGEATTAPA